MVREWVCFDELKVLESFLPIFGSLKVKNSSFDDVKSEHDGTRYLFFQNLCVKMKMFCQSGLFCDNWSFIIGFGLMSIYFVLSGSLLSMTIAGANYTS